MTGRDAVRDYWARQFEQIDPRVDPVGFSQDEDERISVDVHQVIRGLDGAVLADSRVIHVYAFRDGLIERMDVVEPEG